MQLHMEEQNAIRQSGAHESMETGEVDESLQLAIQLQQEQLGGMQWMQGAGGSAEYDEDLRLAMQMQAEQNDGL